MNDWIVLLVAGLVGPAVPLIYRDVRDSLRERRLQPRQRFTEGGAAAHVDVAREPVPPALSQFQPEATFE